MLNINLPTYSSQPPSRSAPVPPAAASAPTNLNTFLFSVATGVTVVLVSEGCKYLANRASGNKEMREQELKLQQEYATQQRMALILEFCKDETYSETCQKLKQQYLDSQLALKTK